MEEKKEKEIFELSYNSSFQEISLSQYLQRVQEDRSIVESSAERLYRIVSKGRERTDRLTHYPFFEKGEHRIEGIRDVLDRFVNGLYVALNSYERGQIPLILLIGPPGSGKSEIGKLLEDGLIDDLARNPRYTYYLIDNKRERYCPFKEDPIALITDPRLFFPNEIKQKYANYQRGYLCPYCFETLNRLLRKHSKEKNINPTSELFVKEDKILEALDEIVKVIRLSPQIASLELAHKDFSEMFEAAIRNANRGILKIEIDDKKIHEIPATNYQLLTKLRDARVSLKNGLEFIPDLAVFLYTNAKLEEILTSPLKDSIYPIFVRRNLSYTAEENILKRGKLPFKHLSPHSLTLLARFAVATRIDTFDENTLEKHINIYEKYEMGKPLSEEELEVVGERLSEVTVSKNGWERGLSSRALIFELFSFRPQGSCFTLESVEKYLEKKSKEFELPVKLCLERLKNIAFRDVIMSYMINLVAAEKGIETLEDLFSYYISLFKAKALEGKTGVEVIGRGMIPIDEEMDKIAKKLNLYKDKEGRKELDETIDKYFGERKEPPTLSEILLQKPELVHLSPELMNFIPWREVKRGVDLNPKDRARVEKLVGILKKDLSYCDECAFSVINLAARKLVKE